jgi:hypothetical protein
VVRAQRTGGTASLTSARGGAIASACNARAGESPTGIDQPNEWPRAAERVLQSAGNSVEAPPTRVLESPIER